MASLTAVRAKHATLSSTTVDTVTLSAQCSSILVTNRDATNAISVTFGLEGATAAVPTALGDDTFVVRASEAKGFSFGPTITSVKIIGNGGGYSVEGS